MEPLLHCPLCMGEGQFNGVLVFPIIIYECGDYGGDTREVDKEDIICPCTNDKKIRDRLKRCPE